MPPDLEILRHSTSHIMAQAVCQLFPEAKLAIGPAIEDGFYYDFDLPQTLTPEDLPKIEEKMREIIKKDLTFKREEVPKEKALKFWQEKGQTYKVELIKEIIDPTVTFYEQGDFVDLCRGPHLNSTVEIKYFKLLSVAGAYWRGDESQPMLQRIYGTAFNSQKELDEYIYRIEEAKKRDHRKLGKDLELFSIFEEAGSGLIYYHPKGATLRRNIEEFVLKEHLKRGYEQVIIPHLAKIDLWEKSGHSEYYAENMYFLNIEKQKFVLKPMNCPGHILIYQTKLRSYRDLPLRFFELGTVYRYEKSGVLHGLLRVRGFTQDDAHIFCAPDQLEEEIIKVMEFAFYMMKTFGFEYQIFLSTRPEKYVGTLENWEKATSALEQALKHHQENYEVDEGQGVFYGPKIDLKLKDALGRLWQGPTIQVDFNLPQRFNLKYIGPDGNAYQPAMIHRVVLGSMERFIGALIEHYAGAFPFWLAPVQLIVLPLTERNHLYAEKILKQLKEKEFRSEIDTRNEKINLKIREAQLQKIPYMIIVGDKEEKENLISVRERKDGDLGQKSLSAFMEIINTQRIEKNFV